MPERNDVTWNTLISAYLDGHYTEYAINLFIEMQSLGVLLSPFSLSGALVACVQLEEDALGEQVHCLSLKLGLDCDVVVGTGLIDMYAKCGDVVASRRVFDQLRNKSVMCWSSMVSAYSRNDCLDEAMVMLRGMLRESNRPFNLTYNNLLSSCCCPVDLPICNEIHSLIIKEGFESDTYVVVTLLIAYSECFCSIEDFYKVCFSLTEWDQVAWNAVIAGFSNLGIGDEAVKCFSRMREAGISVDYFTFSSVITSLGTMLAIEEGTQIHGLIFKTGNDLNIYVLNSLVSMYARCDRIEEAKKVFFSMQKHDVISWNGLLSGCAYHGYTREVVEIFEKMRRSVVKPNPTTFLIVLSACSHGGLLDDGLRYFDLMVKDESLTRPKLEHYACVVDLYGRAGYLDIADSFINSMPIDPGPYVFKTLLSACQIHGNREIAERCARKLLELCPTDPASYVLLANVLSTEGNWHDAAEIRKVMMEKGATKQPGCSWI
ncbi:hypothetical protein LIER_09554 [Lithospermum erythrorhizon]|uniref:Pentatricopeptide repeat-containing protein n=1 Tax=Lithospermum erythrorhizon TaxID=34254 RepID=A0AAV3PG89_LITER